MWMNIELKSCIWMNWHYSNFSSSCMLCMQWWIDWAVKIRSWWIKLYFYRSTSLTDGNFRSLLLHGFQNIIQFKWVGFWSLSSRNQINLFIRFHHNEMMFPSLLLEYMHYKNLIFSCFVTCQLFVVLWIFSKPQFGPGNYLVSLGRWRNDWQYWLIRPL